MDNSLSTSLQIVLSFVCYRGVLCQSIIRAQAALPTFTHVYAALVAILNTKVSVVLIDSQKCEKSYGCMEIIFN